MLLINLLKNSSFPGQLNLKHTKKVTFTASTDSIQFNPMKKYLPTGTIRSSVFFSHLLWPYEIFSELCI